ncbi:MAG: hypothetical protein J7502_17975 [Flavisolibacter sp.]|nr:hypothetical protein [Flavisolibacter sp.]
MEVSTQISYKGYRADYKITSFNSIIYHAELVEFSGATNEYPPEQFHFVKINDRAIASSDVICIAKDILKEIQQSLCLYN